MYNIKSLAKEKIIEQLQKELIEGKTISILILDPKSLFMKKEYLSKVVVS